MSNPLNIRSGDTIEYTGKSWWANLKQVVDHVSERGMHWANGSWCEWSPGEGFEYVVHYAPQEGDRYYVEHNGVTYFIEGGRIWWQDKDLRRECVTPLDQITSEVFKRLSSEPVEPSPVGEAPPATTKQWVAVEAGGAWPETGDLVRFKGDVTPHKAIVDSNEFITVEIAPGVAHDATLDDLEVLRDVIQLPTQFGHYESIQEGVTYDLNEDGWSEMNGGERVSIPREQVEESAPLTRIFTADEADERKQGALDQQREQNEGKRANARARYDRYQEELMSIIRRRNEENIRLRELLEEAGIKW